MTRPLSYEFTYRLTRDGATQWLAEVVMPTGYTARVVVFPASTEEEAGQLLCKIVGHAFAAGALGPRSNG
jgi:hypothetical protein